MDCAHVSVMMKKSGKTSVPTVYADCPYCDGENPLDMTNVSRTGGEREIACKYCSCIFTLAESKFPVRGSLGDEQESKQQVA